MVEGKEKVLGQFSSAFIVSTENDSGFQNKCKIIIKFKKSRDDQETLESSGNVVSAYQ